MGCGKRVSDNPTDQEAYAYLKEAIDANPDMDFFIYAGSGGPTDAASMRAQMAYFEAQDAFSYGPDPKVNHLYYVISNFPHGDLYVPYYYYPQLTKGNTVFRGLAAPLAALSSLTYVSKPASSTLPVTRPCP